MVACSVVSDHTVSGCTSDGKSQRNLVGSSAQLDRIVTNQQGIADLAGEYEAGKDEGVRSVASSDDGGFMDAINSSDDVNSDIFGATTTARNVDGAANNAPKTANWFD